MSEQPWPDEKISYGRIFVVTANPISEALVDLGRTIGRDGQSLSDGQALTQLRDAGLQSVDAVVLCDHDTADRDRCCDTRLPRRRGM